MFLHIVLEINWKIKKLVDFRFLVMQKYTPNMPRAGLCTLIELLTRLQGICLHKEVNLFLRLKLKLLAVPRNGRNELGSARNVSRTDLGGVPLNRKGKSQNPSLSPPPPPPPNRAHYTPSRCITFGDKTWNRRLNNLYFNILWPALRGWGWGGGGLVCFHRKVHQSKIF